MAVKTYSMVGRYTSGNQVTGYHLVDTETREGRKFTREQVVFLIGADRVVNCRGQINGGDVIIRGKGFEMRELPIVREDGSINTRQNDAAGQMRRGATSEMVLQGVRLVAAVTHGRSTVGYVVQDTARRLLVLSRMQTMQLAQKGMVNNARVQSNNGTLILRGVGCNLNELRSVSWGEAQTKYPLSKGAGEEITASLAARVG